MPILEPMNIKSNKNEITFEFPKNNFDKKFKCFPGGIYVKDKPCQEIDIKTYVSIREKAIKEKIHKDLIKIADKGECEELRREVENYFK